MVVSNNLCSDQILIFRTHCWLAYQFVFQFDFGIVGGRSHAVLQPSAAGGQQRRIRRFVRDAFTFPRLEQLRDALLLPIPILEQIGDGIAKSRQKLLAFQLGPGTEKPALVRHVADLDAIGIRIDDPGYPRAAAEKVPEPFIELGASVVR